MVIGDLDLDCITLPPHEADTPLLVDSNGVLTEAVARELFQPIAWWNAQIVEAHSRIDEK